jgi:hypothetical protein
VLDKSSKSKKRDRSYGERFRLIREIHWGRGGAEINISSRLDGMYVYTIILRILKSLLRLLLPCITFTVFINTRINAREAHNLIIKNYRYNNFINNS